MNDSAASLHACIESLWLHLRCLQRAGLKFDALAAQSGQTACALAPGEQLAALRSETADCRRCRLCSARTHVIFGEGSARARLMFVGSAPDSASDAQGRPFAGESGELLTRIIEAIGLQRSQVYLTDAVKCLAPQQDDPGDDAGEACFPILKRQIEIIQPDIICALGPAAARTFREQASGAGPARGQFHRAGTMLVMPTHHPELLLRRPELKRETWIDVQRIQRELESAPLRER